jgi:hypothetical protein
LLSLSISQVYGFPRIRIKESIVLKLKLSFLAFWRKITNKKQVDLQEILARPENQPDYKQE